METARPPGSADESTNFVPLESRERLFSNMLLFRAKCMDAVAATEFEFIVIAMVLSSLILVCVDGRHPAAPLPVG
jgi:hypothetical protein